MLRKIEIMKKTFLYDLAQIGKMSSNYAGTSNAWYGFFSGGQVYLDLRGVFNEAMLRGDYLTKLRSKIEQITAPGTLLVPGYVEAVVLENNHLYFHFQDLDYGVRILESQIVCLM